MMGECSTSSSNKLSNSDFGLQTLEFFKVKQDFFMLYFFEILKSVPLLSTLKPSGP